jgi:hypothetical protein
MGNYFFYNFFIQIFVTELTFKHLVVDIVKVRVEIKPYIVDEK